MADDEIEVDEMDGADQSVSAVETRREYGVYCFGLIISVILLAMIVLIIVVLLWAEGKDAAILLPVLLVLLILMAIGSFVFIKWQHNNAVDKRNQGATEWIHRTLSQQQLPVENIATVKSSWAFWRKTSLGSSGAGRPTPTAPSESTNTSMTASDKPSSVGPPGYQVISTREVTV